MTSVPSCSTFDASVYNTCPRAGMPETSTALRVCEPFWYLQAERNRSQRKQQFVSRTIFHPSFKNVSMPEAIALLGKEGETSRWLFRPSNKGTHQISITMKVNVHPTSPTSLLPPPSAGLPWISGIFDLTGGIRVLPVSTGAPTKSKQGEQKCVYRARLALPLMCWASYGSDYPVLLLTSS